MSRKYTLDDVVTQFLLNTCRLRRHRPSKLVVQAASCCGSVLAWKPDKDVDWELILLITGSVAEFYRVRQKKVNPCRIL